MKIDKESVVYLVLNLTPREKQEFKKMFTGNYDYIKLFNHILKNKNFDEEAFLEELKSEKTSEKASVNISVIKAYLVEKILESLRSSHKNIQSKILNDLIFSQILMRKGSFDLARCFLDEGIKLAKRYDYLQEEVLFNQEFMKMATMQSISNDYIDNFEEFINRRRSLSSEINIVNESREINIQIQLFIFFRVSPSFDFFSVLEQLTKINEDDDKLLFGTKIMIKQAKSTLAFFSQDILKAQALQEEILTIFIENIEEIERVSHVFLNYMLSYLLYSKAEESSFTIEKFNRTNQSLEKFSKITTSPIDLFRCRELQFAIKTSYIKIGSNTVTKAIVQRLRKEFQELEKEQYPYHTQLRILTLYDIMRLSITIKDYNAALDDCNVMMNSKNYSAKKISIGYSSVIMSYIQCHYELGNHKFLLYELDKCKQLTQKHYCYLEYEENFFEMMKILLSNKSNLQKSESLKQFRIYFVEMSNQGHFKSNFNLFSAVNWIDSLISRISKLH